MISFLSHQSYMLVIFTTEGHLVPLGGCLMVPVLSMCMCCVCERVCVCEEGWLLRPCCHSLVPTAGWWDHSGAAGGDGFKEEGTFALLNHNKS